VLQLMGSVKMLLSSDEYHIACKYRNKNSFHLINRKLPHPGRSGRQKIAVYLLYEIADRFGYRGGNKALSEGNCRKRQWNGRPDYRSRCAGYHLPADARADARAV